MTDNEIIKALECCFTNNFDDCEGCPLKDKRDDIFSCMRTKQELTLDLINRQKAEIERLNDKYKCLEASSLIFKGGVDYFVKEAIKEFAERLKENEGRRGVPIGTIDRLVKEMTEQKNEGKE